MPVSFRLIAILFAFFVAVSAPAHQALTICGADCAAESEEHSDNEQHPCACPCHLVGSATVDSSAPIPVRLAMGIAGFVQGAERAVQGPVRSIDHPPQLA